MVHWCNILTYTVLHSHFCAGPTRKLSLCHGCVSHTPVWYTSVVYVRPPVCTVHAKRWPRGRHKWILHLCRSLMCTGILGRTRTLQRHRMICKFSISHSEKSYIIINHTLTLKCGGPKPLAEVSSEYVCRNIQHEDVSWMKIENQQKTCIMNLSY